MSGKDIRHTLERDRPKTTLTKVSKYTCPVRILNTYREHMSGKDIRHTLERDRPKTTLTKVSKRYMPGKGIGHIKIEYTCSVRILNTNRQNTSGKDIRHTLEKDRPKTTLTKVSKRYMPGKGIGHIKIEYTCSVRILNT